MKIAVIAANGQAGSLIVNEAIERGHDVTAVVRSENKSKAEQVLKKDLFSLTKEDLEKFDVVINAFGAWDEEGLKQHKTGAEHLVNILAGSNTRLLVVGGAGSLYVDEDQTTTLSQTPDFPADYLPVANAMAAGLEVYKNANNVKWTYISPAADFDVQAPKTNNYAFAGEVFTMWLFFVATFIAVFILRKREPNLPRPYKVPLYPIVPIIAIIGGSYILVSTLFAQTTLALIGIVLTLLGLLFSKDVHKKIKK